MKCKHTLLGLCGVALVALLVSPAFAEPQVTVKVNQTSDAPQAVVLSTRGKCEYSEDGATFSELKSGRVLNQGAVVRTADGARTDLFFRRIGTAVRLQSATDVKLEKMTRAITNGMPVMETLIDLRKGRIFTVVRSLVPGSALEIRNAAGRSVVEGGGGNGRYIITADGTHVTDKDSVVPLKVLGETGITIITPGQQFHAKDGKVFAFAPSTAVEELINFDEIQALAEELTPSVAPTTLDDSQAVALSVGEKSTFSQNGELFKKLRVGQVLTQGASIRAGDETVVDLFLRRWGATIRLFPKTEMTLEKMSRSPTQAGPALQTRLNLQQGRIFCFIRIPVPDSSFEVKTARGTSLLNSAGAGRYDIQANGSIVAGKSSFKHLKVTTEHGVTMIEPGQIFDANDGHTRPAAPSEVELLMIQMDQLVSLAEQLSAEEALKQN